MYNNRITVKGNLTKDPVFKQIGEDNKSLAEMRIAVTDKIGRDKEETLFIDVDAWGYNADYAKNCDFKKGDKVIVEGRLRSREWTDQNDSKRTSFSISPVSLHKAVKPSGGSSNSNQGYSNAKAANTNTGTRVEAESGGNIPF
jgi:single-strand DNA-binding protein